MNVPLWVKNVRCANRTSDSVEELTHGDERKEPGRQHSLEAAGADVRNVHGARRGVNSVARALGYRGSLQIVNQIAPDNRRAEVVSSYLMFCYAGVPLPVIGIGVLSAIETPGLAEKIFAAVIAAIALIAIARQLPELAGDSQKTVRVDVETDVAFRLRRVAKLRTSQCPLVAHS
jgi:hypothetical protein